MKDYDPKMEELRKQIATIEKMKESINVTTLRLVEVMGLFSMRYRDMLRNARARQYNATMFDPTAEDETPGHYVNMTAAEMRKFVSIETEVNKLVEQIEAFLNQD